MSLPVPLQEVLDAMEVLADEWYAYINRKTGEIVTFGDDDIAAAARPDAEAPEWQRADLPKIRAAQSSDDYVQLPGKFDFHEYAVMERFCLAQESEELRGNLLDLIHGRGAFQRFKDRIYAAGIQDAWYAYRDRARRELAVAFLDSEEIPYVAPPET